MWPENLTTSLKMMTMKFYNLLAILLGYGLIIAGFILLGNSLERNVLIMDIVVSCLLFTQVVQLLVFPMIRMNREGHREVGMMGIHYSAVTLYTVLALGVMIYGAVSNWAFRYQLIAQLAALFVFLIGRVATLRAGEKVSQVNLREHTAEEGKKELIEVMDDFLDDVDLIRQQPQEVQDRLKSVHEALRYVTPSGAPEALKYEQQFTEAVANLRVLMRTPNLNGEQIKEETERLTGILSKRKQY
jgi:hypothetical protein